jgi:endonuclease/exonuclease/phosphatase family metal-dependent hydrolase
MLALDRIWAGPQARIDAVRIHRSALARRASDHLPLRATIRIGPA